MRDRDRVLAYTIWHWPGETVDRTEYEAHQKRFHTILAQHPSPGFVASQSSRVTHLPWANGGKDVYQDRYFVEAWSAFDPLEAHAISGAREEAHRHVASTVGGAVAGMYGLHMGKRPKTPRWSYWFSKPVDTTYAQLETMLRPVLKGAALWGRRLVLGPTPEFCVESDASLDLPGIDVALVVRLEPAWHTFDGYDHQRRIESRIIT